MAKKRKKRKKKPFVYDEKYLEWRAYYNDVWRHQFGWPKMLKSEGLQGAYKQSVFAAPDQLDEPFPSWEALTLGAKAGIVGWNFYMPRGTWLLEPRGTMDKHLFQMARWGRAVEPEQTINPKFME